MSSLTDAMLLEAHPMDAWIALRTDGAMGSGTENDPWNGGTRNTPTFSVSGISRSSVTATATAGNHPFKDGDLVLIAGVTGADARFYNGTFAVSNVTTNTFQYTMWGTPDGSATNQGITARLDPYLFDAVMRSLPTGTPVAVHLGPGTFETKGFSEYTAASWKPFSGLKLRGSGIAVTTLKLVDAVVKNALYFAIGMSYGDRVTDVEVSDFTVDCNLAGQPVTPPEGGTTYRRARLGCAAVSVRGDHIRIRRIRAINFGTQGVYVTEADRSPECFVIYSAGAYVDGNPTPTNCVIEDCIVEQPSGNNTFVTTCVIMGGGEAAYSGVMSYHRGCVIRRCHVDCEYRDRPVPIASITINSQTGVATATTRLPHGRNDGEWVVISGALENGSPNTTYNGSYVISVDPSYPSQFTYTPWDGAGHPRPTVDATGDMWLGRYSSHPVPISTVSWAGGVVTVITATPHFRCPSGNVWVGEVRVGSPLTDQNAYNGVFELAEVPNPYELKYNLATFPGAADCFYAFIGAKFQAYTADGGTGAVIEDNYARQVGNGVFHDSYSSKDLTVRNNVFTEVGMGVMQNMGKSNTAKVGSTLTHDGKIATFTTVLEHGLAAGDAVIIGNTTYPEFNNSPIPPPARPPAWEVKSVPEPNKFTYEMRGEPAGDEPSPPAFTFQTLWQERRLAIENNVIELKAAIKWWGEPTGLWLTGGDFASPYVFRQVVVRENIIRHAVGVADPPGLAASRGIVLASAEKAIVQNNVIDVERDYPIVWDHIGAMRLFNNRTSGGKLLDGYKLVTLECWRDAAKDVEDSFILALT